MQLNRALDRHCLTLERRMTSTASLERREVGAAKWCWLLCCCAGVPLAKLRTVWLLEAFKLPQSSHVVASAEIEARSMSVLLAVVSLLTRGLTKILSPSRRGSVHCAVAGWLHPYLLRGYVNEPLGKVTRAVTEWQRERAQEPRGCPPGDHASFERRVNSSLGVGPSMRQICCRHRIRRGRGRRVEVRRVLLGARVISERMLLSSNIRRDSARLNANQRIQKARLEDRNSATRNKNEGKSRGTQEGEARSGVQCEKVKSRGQGVARWHSPTRGR
ncbi:hypothetical protein B0H17DRAFT_1123616 [Mycena rosella]|uniref:Uncharacterized protein n=1 Tax=Mycena rosella TaxID=1033263 RepID=A0AAD7H200_MYCRO|nr:hypothetical protein B0H17DRAFT_1123616 [Mycena rosella]